jgi:glycosyltransferase involved in cell wall biosynthesis
MLWPFAATLRETLAVPALFTVHVHQAALNRLRGVTERTMSLDGQERALVEADAVLTPSLSCTASVRTDHPERPIFTTPLGVFDSDAARAAVDGRTERCRDTVLYVGRFADIKGTEDFFEVARRVLAKRPASRAVVVGGVPDNPKAERRWRRRWEEGTSPTLVERLRFEGWCTPAALSVHLAAARVLVVPSWTETFGLTVLEAMLHATPVVASACPAIAELLDDGRTGLLAPVRDVAALVGCVERLLDDDELAVTLGHQAAVRARAVHRWAQTVHGTRMAYRSATLTQPA